MCKNNYNFDCIADLLNYIFIIADNNLSNITCKYENNIDYFKIIINNKKKINIKLYICVNLSNINEHNILNIFFTRYYFNHFFKIY